MSQKDNIIKNNSIKDEKENNIEDNNNIIDEKQIKEIEQKDTTIRIKHNYKSGNYQYINIYKKYYIIYIYIFYNFKYLNM